MANQHLNQVTAVTFNNNHSDDKLMETNISLNTS